MNAILLILIGSLAIGIGWLWHQYSKTIDEYEAYEEGLRNAGI